MWARHRPGCFVLYGFCSLRALLTDGYFWNTLTSLLTLPLPISAGLCRKVSAGRGPTGPAVAALTGHQSAELWGRSRECVQLVPSSGASW